MAVWRDRGDRSWRQGRLEASPQTRPLAILLGSGVAPKAGPDSGEDS